MADTVERIALERNREAIQERANPLGQTKQSIFGQAENARAREFAFLARAGDQSDGAEGSAKAMTVIEKGNEERDDS